MIKLRLSAMTHDSSDKNISFKEGENLSDLMQRVFKENNLEDASESFQVLVDGIKVEPDFWEYTKLESTSRILIAPKIQGGDFGQIFKSVVVLVVTVVAAYFTAGASLAVQAGVTAAVTIGSTLLMNALIPPPGIGGAGDAGVSSGADSQMYSITSQANAVKKFGAVHKVYGVHRVFPTVAVQPYTEIEVDPSTKDFVQYFYAVYDLGFGPSYVTDIKIGDTPIQNFADASYRLVDFNKPAISEGVWDEMLEDDLFYYKGDVNTDSLSIFINKNAEDTSAAEEDFRVIRNSAPNDSGFKQEIILTFVNPEGLISYGTNGETGTATIDLIVEFAKVGTEDWKPYNDRNFVDSALSVGGIVDGVTRFNSVASWTTPFIYATPEVLTSWSAFSKYREYTSESSYGLLAGTTEIVISQASGVVSVGSFLVYKGTTLGKIISVVGDTNFYTLTLENPIPNTIEVQRVRNVKRVNTDTGYYTVVTTVLMNFNRQDWSIEFDSLFTIRRQETRAAYSTLKFTPKETGQFKVRVTRMRSRSAYSYRVMNNLAWAAIQTRFDREPIQTNKRHVFLEIRIRATNQLNGSIQNLSAVTQSALDVWDGTTWTKQLTQNPAWVFCDLLTGEINREALSKDRIHLPSLLEWAEFCDEVPDSPPGVLFEQARFKTNFILDFDTTLQNILNQVANAAQASLNIIDGKYGVLLDRKKDIPVQVFTPRNSSGFSSVRNYGTDPHALKIQFVDPNSNWEVSEEIVYADGYNADTAEEFEDLSSFACTDSDQAWRFGRYMMAQNKLRKETISIKVDFEFLVCTRGDYVQISQDVMKVGGTPARIKTVVGNTVTIDEGLIVDPLLNYGYVARGVSGIVSSTLTILSADTLQLNGLVPKVGDLIVVGEMGKVVYDCIVKSIYPDSDMTATLTLVEKADAIYDAESSGMLPDYDPQISEFKDDSFPPAKVTELIVEETSWLCGANSFEHYIELDWDVPANTAFEIFEIYVDSGLGYDVAGTTKETRYTYFVNQDRVGLLHKFKVVAVSATGKKLDLIDLDEVESTPLKKTSNPASIESMATNITGEVLQLDWEAVKDCIREYLIRYSPNLNATWESSIPLLRVDKNTTLASTQARTGVYLIKAVDFNDNESVEAIAAITTIPELFGLNIISEVTDFPVLEGAKDKVQNMDGNLILQNVNTGSITENEYYPVGYYYYKEFLELDAIYTVRLQSLIQAEGFTLDDVMANWVTLESVIALANSRFSEWDVQSEYRTTDRHPVMGAWPSLDVIDPISEGYQENWTEWRRFSMGDGTGKIFQFRLKLISNKASVSPRVFDGTIRVDVPDRVESYNNLVCPPEGLVINYTPPFLGPGNTPSIQITIDNGRSGDYWEFEYKNLDGFKIVFYDKDGTAVNRTMDAIIKGYGRKAYQVI